MTILWELLKNKHPKQDATSTDVLGYFQPSLRDYCPQDQIQARADVDLQNLLSFPSANLNSSG
jgi:hypothetical protein